MKDIKEMEGKRGEEGLKKVKEIRGKKKSGEKNKK